MFLIFKTITHKVAVTLTAIIEIYIFEEKTCN